MKRGLTILGMLVTIVLSIGLGAIFLATPADQAVAQAGTADSRLIHVSGHGRISAQPDTAVVRLGVQTEADTADGALNENNDRMTAVISATIEAGVSEEDIQTQNFRLQPVYDRGEDETRELTGYRASNIVRLTVRDLDQLGAILDTAVSAGGNTVEGIQFEISDREDLEAAAREAAMNDAIQKADQLTALADAELGPVQTISESGGTRPVPEFEAVQESAAASVPVQPGTQFIEANIQVSWEIQ